MLNAIVSFFFLSSTVFAQGIITLKRNTELLRTYEEVTGVNKDSEILKIYQASFLSLPKDGLVTEMTGFTAVGMFNLTTTFCSKMIAKDRRLSPSERWIHAQMDLEKDVQTWSLEEKNVLFFKYAEFFWGRIPLQGELAKLVGIFDFVAQEPAPLNQELVLNSVCTSMLLHPAVFTK